MSVSGFAVKVNGDQKVFIARNLALNTRDAGSRNNRKEKEDVGGMDNLGLSTQELETVLRDESMEEKDFENHSEIMGEDLANQDNARFNPSKLQEIQEQSQVSLGEPTINMLDMFIQEQAGRKEAKQKKPGFFKSLFLCLTCSSEGGS